MSHELHQAALDGNVEKVEALLAQGVNLLEQDASGRYPLFCALELPAYHASELRKNKETIFQMLLPHYEKVQNLRDVSGDTLGHYIAKYGYDVLFLMLKQQPEAVLAFSSENNFGQKPIHLAIMNKKNRMFELLLTIPDMAGTLDWNQQNLLHHIAHYGTPSMLRFFCKHYAVSTVINAPDSQGRTPAQLAVEFNVSSDVNAITDILLEYGAQKVARPLTPF